MAFWSDGKWHSLANSGLVDPFDPSRIEDANYLLAIGDEVYISSTEKGNTVKQLKEKESFSLSPGQFAYILTAERVSIPFNAIGLISIRASVKFNGLVNISGFHVDPGYDGKLIFAVFNAGPIAIHLTRGQPMFPIWLADLDMRISRTRVKKGHMNIPSSLITSVSGNYTTAFEVNDSLRTQRKEMESKFQSHGDDISKLKEQITDLRSFKTYVGILIAIILLVFVPTLQDRVRSMFKPTESKASIGAATGTDIGAPVGASKLLQGASNPNELLQKDSIKTQQDSGPMTPKNDR